MGSERNHQVPKLIVLLLGLLMTNLGNWLTVGILYSCLGQMGSNFPLAVWGKGADSVLCPTHTIKLLDFILYEFLSLTLSLSIYIQECTHFCPALWSLWKRRTISTVSWTRSQTPWSIWWPRLAWLYSSSTGAWPSSSSSSPTSGTWGEAPLVPHRIDINKKHTPTIHYRCPRKVRDLDVDSTLGTVSSM